MRVLLECILAKFSVSMTFLGDRDGDGDGTGRTDGRTNGHMDRQTFLGKYYFRFGVFIANSLEKDL